MTTALQPTTTTSQWASHAFNVAVEAGYRPSAETITVTFDFTTFNALVRPSDARAASPKWEGLCGRSGDGQTRVVWIKPQQDPGLEIIALTHELAHAVLPWSINHDERWLSTHLGILKAGGRSDLCVEAARQAAIQYKTTVA